MRHPSLSVTIAAVLTLACAGSPAPAPAPVQATPAPDASPPRAVITRVRISEPYTPRTDTASLLAFLPDVAAVDSGGECSVMRTDGSGATMVMASFPSRAASRTGITLTFDSLGHLVRYSERRGESLRIAGAQNMSDAQRDSAMAAQTRAHRDTHISLDYAIDQAVASNSGGGQPTQAVLGTVRMMEHLKALGPPSVRLARVRTLCGV